MAETMTMARVRACATWALRAVIGPLLALLLALLCGQLLVLVCGDSPARVFAALLAGTWGNAYGFGQVLFKATPLILTGLAVAIPYRAGLFNIGAEGQAVLGALATGVIGMLLPADTSAILALPAVILGGFAVGAGWGALPGWLKARTGAHEVITTIMLNFVALALANWLVAGHLAVPESLHTPAVVAGARLARASAWFPALHGSALNLSTLLVLGLLPLCWWLVFRTRRGFELRVVGYNPVAARFAGIAPGRVGTLAMALGGGLAGLVGCNFVLGYKGWYEDGFSGGIGFMGIAVALLGRAHPAGILLAALLFGTLSQGGLAINALVPKELVDVLQAVVILALLCTARLAKRAGGGAA